MKNFLVKDVPAQHLQKRNKKPGKPISKSQNPGLAKLAEKKPKLAKKFGYNPNRMVAKKGGRARKK